MLNVRSFTSIGNIFGGGYGDAAVMVGSPTVNINEALVEDDADTGSSNKAFDEETKTLTDLDGNQSQVTLYAHEAGKIGVIGNVFGGGNAAKVIGNTNVNVGTTSEEPFISLPINDSAGKKPTDDGWKPTYQKKPVVGADIRGNVYGGGNNAVVTGNTNVVIGQEATTSTTTNP